MLIQHILTEEIFAKVFDDADFHRQNNVARELYALEAAFFTGALKKQTLKGLEPYYAAIRAAAAQIGSHAEKQTFLKAIYENFYKVYNAKAADRLGVVYTPGEIVRFMIDGADWLCEKHFGRNLIDRDVDILDPATGTGTFICELLEHFRGQPQKIKHKYRSELHANEVAILPYYVANLNIEATYAAISGEYAEFPSLCFVDTLDNVGLHTAAKGTTADLFGSVSEENVARIKRQNARRISVIIGNPPYNANQANENDNNKNREYPQIDARIKQTYIAASTAQKTKLYDMYARFFRWASDRLDANGVLAFVTNRSFIDSRTFDGFCKTVAREFAEIYVVDLGGDVRANPKLSGTKHNMFGIQTGVAISFMVKKHTSASAPSAAVRERAGVRVSDRQARVYYARRPEMETAEEKLAFLGNTALRNIAFDEARPDKAGNWINLTHNDFDALLPLASKETKAAKTAAQERAVFKLFSLGVVTNRDEWVYDEDDAHLSAKVRFLIATYNDQLAKPNSADLGTLIKWTRALKAIFVRGQSLSFDPAYVFTVHSPQDVCTSTKASTNFSIRRLRSGLGAIPGNPPSASRQAADWNLQASQLTPFQASPFSRSTRTSASLYIVTTKMATATTTSPTGRSNNSPRTTKPKNPHPNPLPPAGEGANPNLVRARSPRKPSFTTATPCCTTRCTARNTRRTSSANSRAFRSTRTSGNGPRGARR
ncbi:N-6 DNA methylase [mine drainage metagenome]|uniref:site-specific DNA-methyltransferase (adenine-specific) n=1 Tax=mine drainage metagenome TaxID=410659 RepID=A0A1J5QAS0_9ZZZZ